MRLGLAGKAIYGGDPDVYAANPLKAACGL